MSSCCVCHEKFDIDQHVPIIGLCGHSVCERCTKHVIPGSRRHISCPLCKKADSFRNLKRNYQMIDVMTEIEAMTKKQKKLIDEHRLESRTLLECYVCSCIVEEKQSRICKPCGWKNGQITVHPNADTVTVRDINALPSFAMCGTCFLEGAHKGHESISYLIVKSKNTALSLLDKVETTSREVTAASVQRGFRLQAELALFRTTVKERRKKASTSLGVQYFEEVIANCNQQLQVLREVEDRSTSCFGQQMLDIQKVKKVMEGHGVSGSQ